MSVARSGQVTVTTAGTAVQGPTTPLGELFAIQGHPDNTEEIWIGNDGAGDVTSSNGFSLAAGKIIEVDVSDVGNLSGLYFDAEVNGEKAVFLRLK